MEDAPARREKGSHITEGIVEMARHMFKRSLCVALAFSAFLVAAAIGFAAKEAASHVAGSNDKPRQGSSGEPDIQGVKMDSIQQKVLEFNLEGYSDKGDKRWEIKGESAEAMQENQIKLNNIVARTYGDEAEATLRADKGIYDKSKNNVMLEENVKVTIENVAGLTNQYASFPSISPAGDSGGSEVPSGGAAMAGQPDKSQKKTMTTITCDGEVEFSYEKNEAHFAKNVKVLSEDGEIDADKITVYLDIKSKKLKEVVAEGNVKISRGENVTYSDRATYIEAEKKVVLSGRPKLIFYAEGGIEGQFLGQLAAPKK